MEVIMQTLKVFLADDHAPFRHSLAEFLQSQPGVQVVGEAADGAAAVEQVGQLHPDLVLMDASMPKLGGYEATRAIKRDHPNTHVVILSSHIGEVYRKAAFESAADGYIEKNSVKTALLSLIEKEQRRTVRVAI